MNRILRAVVVALFALSLAGIAGAQVAVSNQASVALNMTIAESVTVSASPASISFTYNPSGAGSATASGPITVITTANVGTEYTKLAVAAWLSSATAALGGPQSIPSSQVFASVNGSTATACTSTLGFSFSSVAGAGCSNPSAAGAGEIDDMQTLNHTAGIYTLTDAVLLSLNNLGNLISGSYSGTINFQAQAF